MARSEHSTRPEAAAPTGAGRGIWLPQETQRKLAAMVSAKAPRGPILSSEVAEQLRAKVMTAVPIHPGDVQAATRERNPR